MRPIISCLTGWLCLAALLQAQPVTFTVTDGGDNRVRFESKAPLETVVGTTDQVHGSVTLDPVDLSSGVSAEIVVDAASIKTGNSIRDGHMRNNHLQTDKYPEIEFTLENLKLEGALQRDQTRQFKILGEFSLHGVTRTIGVPVQVTLSNTGSERRLHVTGSFTVGLSEYDIPRPQFLVMRLDEVQNITIDFWGVAK